MHKTRFYKGISMKNIKFLLSLMLLMPFALLAQDSSEKDVEEVVVVGYGTVRKSDLTGAVSSVELWFPFESAKEYP